jgi:hypothetical protein
MVQAVSRRLPTSAARVRAQVVSYEICGGQSGTGTSFLGALRFVLSRISPTARHSSSSSIIQGWYNRPVVASVIVDSVPLAPKKEIKK